MTDDKAHETEMSPETAQCILARKSRLEVKYGLALNVQIFSSR